MMEQSFRTKKSMSMSYMRSYYKCVISFEYVMLMFRYLSLLFELLGYLFVILCTERKLLNEGFIKGAKIFEKT